MKEKIMLYGVSIMHGVIGGIILGYGLNKKSPLVTYCGGSICFMAGRDAMASHIIKKTMDENYVLTYENNKLKYDLSWWKNRI